MKVRGWLLNGLALAIVLAFALGDPIAWGQAALIMWDVAAGGKPTLWQDLTARPADYVKRWPDGEGDVYEPGGKTRAAMVLVPGAAVLGRDEPRLKALARTFARAGFVVLVPELPEVRRLALSRADADRVAAALRQLHQWQPAEPLGVAAVSYAVAPAVIAALQDDLVGKVKFVVGIGGYRDAEAAIRFVTTGSFRPMGEAREFQVKPNNYGRWAFVLANAGRLDNGNDAALLQEIARARFRDPAADVTPLAAKLGPQGRAVLALVENRDPDAVTRLVGALPESVRREIDGLNLALYDLSKFRGDLILVHGRGDPLVPYSESQALAAAASNAHVSLFLIDDLGHVDFNAVTAANAWTMWRAVLTLLQERR
jgi:acetyl esterase/lipase